MSTLDVNKIFKRALQGKGPTGFQKFRDIPASPVSAQSNYLLNIESFIERLEDYTGDYAHAVMYGRDALDDFLAADESDFEIGENVKPLTEAELENLRFSPANGELDDNLYKDTPEDFNFENLRATFFLYLQEGSALMNISMSDICEALGKDYHTIWDKYVMDQGDIDDADLVMISSQMHGEIQAFKETLLTGRRMTETPISDYIANKPLKFYKQDPEEAQPNQP